MEEVIKKLKFKGKGCIINAPIELAEEFKKLGHELNLWNGYKSENVLVFIKNSAEFISFLENNLELIKKDNILWLAYPKGTSKIKTDINRDILRMTSEQYGITTVTAISINDIWSGLRFRPTDRVGK